MKYSKKFRKKPIFRKKSTKTSRAKKIKQRKTKLRKTKLLKKRGGAAEDPPPSPQLISQPSGQPLFAVNQQTGYWVPLMEQNIQRVWQYLQENPHCKTQTNCLPLSTYTLSSHFNPAYFEKWVKERDEFKADGPYRDFVYEKTNQRQTAYMRNFSSRPPILNNGETEEKIWTDEPLKDFIRELIQSGAHPKDYINQMQSGLQPGTQTDPTFEYGCIQIVLYNMDFSKQQNAGTHAINICRMANGEIAIVDLQHPYTPIIQNADAIDDYLSAFSANIFAILTTNESKHNAQLDKLFKRMNQFSINQPLINDSGHAKTPNNITYLDILWHTSFDHKNVKITPAVLAYPYNEEFYDTNTTLLFPHLLGSGGLDNSLWPQSVINTWNKYAVFQYHNDPYIKKTALSAILKGENNQVLEYLIEQSHVAAPPPPLLLPQSSQSSTSSTQSTSSTPSTESDWMSVSNQSLDFDPDMVATQYHMENLNLGPDTMDED